VTCCESENALSYIIDRGPQGCVFALDFPHEIAMKGFARDQSNLPTERYQRSAQSHDIRRSAKSFYNF